MKRILTLLAALVAIPAAAVASEAGYRLDPAPIDPTDVISLQAGARTFANYCLNCHGAQFMRYNRMTSIGLTEAQIKDNLMPVGEKVGETMKVALSQKDGKAWFGAAPPDLSVVARSRGADWLYTYLRTFYRDDKTVTGWNNAVFPSVAMPHALWTLQGERALKVEEVKEGGHTHVEYKWEEISKGSQSTIEYDRTIRDLVNFLVYVGEPDAQFRKRLGVIVLFVLGLVFVVAYGLKSAYWKDVK